MRSIGYLDPTGSSKLASFTPGDCLYITDESPNIQGGIINILTTFAVGLVVIQQSSISLEEAIDAAVEHSLTARQAEIETAQGRQSVAEGIAAMLPRLSGSTSTGASALDGLGEGNWSTQFGLSQPVVDASAILELVGGFYQNSLKQLESDQTIAGLILDVQNTYYDLASSQAMVESTDKQYERAMENLKITERKFELGSAGLTDKLRTEASVLSAQNQLLTAQASLEGNQRKMSDLMGLEEWMPLVAQDLSTPEFPDSLSTTVVSKAMLDDNPDIKVMRKQVKTSNLSYWGAWAALLPSLSFSASRSFIQEEILPTSWEDGQTSFGLGISLPMVSIKQRILDINSTRLSRKQSRLELATSEQTSMQQLANLVASQELAYRTWETAAKNVELSEEAYRISSRSYELGASSLAELLDVVAELADSEESFIQAQAAYWSARAELNYFLGTNMSLLLEE
jgi:outer membrane protein TolC